MNIPDIDVILSRLSVKFNRIFYEREFVGCVSDDFHKLLRNKNKCVLVFPVLSPNYLKALRYQAKICDLAVLPLSSGHAKSVAVCHKKYLIENCDEKNVAKDEIKMPELIEETTKTLRKKRPERQLYVPPAQRKSRLLTQVPAPRVQPRRKDETKKKKEEKSERFELETLQPPALSLRNVTKYLESPVSFATSKLHKNSVPKYLHDCEFEKCVRFRDENLLAHTIFIFDVYSSNDYLYILDEYRLFWQPPVGIFWEQNDKTSANYKTYPFFDFCQRNNEIDVENKMSAVLSLDYSLLISRFFEETNGDLVEYSSYLVECDEIECSVDFDDIIVDLSIFNGGHIFFIKTCNDFYFYECLQSHDIFKCYNEIKSHGPQIENHTVGSTDDLVEINETIAQNSIESNLENLNILSGITVPINNSQNVAKSLDKAEINVQLEQNNLKNVNETIKNEETKKVWKKKNDHEQEKEIMRKTKEKINRKTRPIIKYVDDDNNTLNIGKNDNVNNWEDLFDDEGQLQQEFFTEIVQKVGSNVKIVKAAEDYTAYASKQLEELEHMVELYDFPSTFETHDIIAAFSDIKSDSMYVKWVDETHALLVLGSALQAQKAMGISNALIKARPMSVASKSALAKANKSDLRPAMKRPQTNLQTARRLITTHLGAKSRVTKEQNAKEREDLKAAREMKKLTRKNEQDAWEGNPKSTISN